MSSQPFDDIAQLTLSNVPSEHMSIAQHSDGRWEDCVLKPYAPIEMQPLALGLHYAQIVFEGMKAYRYDNGDVAVFRIEKHHERFNKSLARMCMPEIPLSHFRDGIVDLVRADRSWVPPGPDSAFYIRPFVIASEERMGIKVSDDYLFMVVGGPFRPLYARPLRVRMERVFARAVAGGTGFAKCAGNYAAAMLPTQLAQQDGFDQVIWTDAKEHRVVEESGTMNVMFVIDGVIVTPALTDTILDGVTRDSVLTIARDLGLPISERMITVDDLAEGLRAGRVTEAFGVGTAAAVAPIGSIAIDTEEFALPVLPTDTMFTLKNHLNAIRYGQAPDVHGWMTVI